MLKKIYTRQELFDLVWNEPLSKLATKFNIETQYLKDICLENNIPLPTRGYWSKVRFNKEIEKITLPKIENKNPKINLDPRQQHKKFKTDYHRRAFELEQRRDLNFKVPARISTYHPLIMTSKKLLEKIDNSEKRLRYWEVANENDLLPIHTDLKHRDRALRFMDTLIKIVEAMGCKIVFYCNSAHVEMFGQKTEINLRQKVYRIRNKDESGWSRESWEKSDKLEFQAGPSFNQKKWIDNTKRKLEECLPEIIAWIEKDCKYWHDLRTEQAIEENKRLLQEQKLEALKKAKESEQAKVNQLFIDAENWNKAKVAEHYISAMEEQAVQKNEMNSNTKDYISWAREVIKKLNPLSDSNWSEQ
ncbi:hypothetical protein MTsPCn9_26200 [Croceitalea sp. MTPC9]|uniref:hypothetical protein n=1 Tax=unclassified Croceitalea TaxID=2632280 RepID=UPI002B383205|nr:hypothetical protein MTsPCn6_28330 [Croceitalea sp. MTPC6]GMN17682.1 hypothetical protein MTsPCn9_26200 [Croceitalea sp. MTPC9]